MAYDDGESEARAEARLITADGGGSDSDRRSDRFREGDKVEADYRDADAITREIDRDRAAMPTTSPRRRGARRVSSADPQEGPI